MESEEEVLGLVGDLDSSQSDTESLSSESEEEFEFEEEDEFNPCLIVPLDMDTFPNMIRYTELLTEKYPGYKDSFEFEQRNEGRDGYDLDVDYIDDSELIGMRYQQTKKRRDPTLDRQTYIDQHFQKDELSIEAKGAIQHLKEFVTVIEATSPIAKRFDMRLEPAFKKIVQDLSKEQRLMKSFIAEIMMIVPYSQNVITRRMRHFESALLSKQYSDNIIKLKEEMKKKINEIGTNSLKELPFPDSLRFLSRDIVDLEDLYIEVENKVRENMTKAEKELIVEDEQKNILSRTTVRNRLREELASFWPKCCEVTPKDISKYWSYDKKRAENRANGTAKTDTTTNVSSSPLKKSRKKSVNEALLEKGNSDKTKVTKPMTKKNNSNSKNKVKTKKVNQKIKPKPFKIDAIDLEESSDEEPATKRRKLCKTTPGGPLLKLKLNKPRESVPTSSPKPPPPRFYVPIANKFFSNPEWDEADFEVKHEEIPDVEIICNPSPALKPIASSIVANNNSNSVLRSASRRKQKRISLKLQSQPTISSPPIQPQQIFPSPKPSTKQMSVLVIPSPEKAIDESSNLTIPFQATQPSTTIAQQQLQQQKQEDQQKHHVRQEQEQQQHKQEDQQQQQQQKEEEEQKYLRHDPLHQQERQEQEQQQQYLQQVQESQQQQDQYIHEQEQQHQQYEHEQDQEQQFQLEAEQNHQDHHQKQEQHPQYQDEERQQYQISPTLNLEVNFLPTQEEQYLFQKEQYCRLQQALQAQEESGIVDEDLSVLLEATLPAGQQQFPQQELQKE
eukprot:TRINITY_DN10537_c0_g1_i1.p1 TRINITY_DN10537_c0_g1~~TRINITY_DN10537_c0_g1_i1.p1  ORF type:complete len:785 (-),score=249.81 TRINITY_DN10537_c0_g1_i1:387-2741(-)